MEVQGDIYFSVLNMSGVCFAFQRGECHRGDSCRFSHMGESAPGEEDAWRAGQQGPFGGGRGACYAFQRGECDRGDTCKFSHGDTGVGAFANFSRGRGPHSSQVCYAFQRGECDRGASCKFSHGKRELTARLYEKTACVKSSFFTLSE